MIHLHYSTIDGIYRTVKFEKLEDAQAYAWKWIGECPLFGRNYAVSDDGIGKFTVEGVTLKELFPRGI